MDTWEAIMAKTTETENKGKKSGSKSGSRKRRAGGFTLYNQLLAGATENAIEPAGAALLPQIASVELIKSVNQSGKINGANVALRVASPGKGDDFPAVFMSMPIRVLEDGTVTQLHMPPRRLRGDNVFLSDRPDARTAVALASIRVGKAGDGGSTYLLTQVPCRGRAEGIFTDVCSQLDEQAIESLRRIGMVYKRKIGETPVDMLAIDMGKVNQALHVFGRVKEDGTLDFQILDDWWSLHTGSATVDTRRNAQNFRGGPGSSSTRAREVVGQLWQAALGTEIKDGQTLAQAIAEFRGSPAEERASRRAIGLQVPQARGASTFGASIPRGQGKRKLAF